MVQLRKRKTPPPETATAPALKKTASKSSVKSNASAKGAAADPNNTASANGSAGSGKIQVGQTIDLERFGGEVETHEGVKVTLKGLIDEAKGDVVVFTYPKASSPGCTTQASLFATGHSSLSSPPHNVTIYGLSSDSPRANTTFKTKQSLPYTLLCDPSVNLISALGLKKSPKGTTRGVVVISKAGEVKLWEAAGPAATVEVVQRMYPASAGSATGDHKGGGEAEVAAAVNHSDGLNSIESNVEKEIQAGKMSAQEADQGKGGEDQDHKMEDAPLPAAPAETNREGEIPSEVAAQVADTAEIVDGDDDAGGVAGGTEGEKGVSDGQEKPSEVAAQVADTAEKIDVAM